MTPMFDSESRSKAGTIIAWPKCAQGSRSPNVRLLTNNRRQVDGLVAEGCGRSCSIGDSSYQRLEAISANKQLKMGHLFQFDGTGAADAVP